MNVEKVVVALEDVDLKIDGITLLSADEYEENRETIPIANNEWWLRSPGYNVDCAEVVTGDGSAM